MEVQLRHIKDLGFSFVFGRLWISQRSFFLFSLFKGVLLIVAVRLEQLVVVCGNRVQLHQVCLHQASRLLGEYSVVEIAKDPRVGEEQVDKAHLVENLELVIRDRPVRLHELLHVLLPLKRILRKLLGLTLFDLLLRLSHTVNENFLQVRLLPVLQAQHLRVLLVLLLQSLELLAVSVQHNL